MVMIVSYGGGLNSTALLIGMSRTEERPAAILFADTGGERPQTYDYIEMFSGWLQERGFPEITRVRARFAGYATLEDNCLVNKTLPSIAFGFKTCSHKWKKQPQEKWANHWQPAKETWAAGSKVTKCIGYDADEWHRAKIPEDSKYVYRYPLVEWDWGRNDCAEAVKLAGLPDPGKSACFFCPSSKKHEIRYLMKNNPDLFARAVAMEENAAENLGVVQGLGRHWSWKQFAIADRAQLKLFDEVPDAPCGCYDG